MNKDGSDYGRRLLLRMLKEPRYAYIHQRAIFFQEKVIKTVRALAFLRRHRTIQLYPLDLLGPGAKYKGEIGSKEETTRMRQTFSYRPEVKEAAAMNFRSGVVGLILLSGLFTVSPYAIYGGSIQAPGRIEQALALAGPGEGSAAGSAAGGRQDISTRAPDCRSCARKGRL